MRISNNNKAVFMGNTLFGGEEMDIREKVAMRKQLHFKEAMHIVTSARAGEKQIDDSIDNMKERVSMLQEENDEANAILNDINAKMAEAKEAYAVGDDSQEQKDLELMQKVYDMKKHGSMNELTEEEKKRYAEMGEPTEYQKLSMELYAQADYWKGKMADNQSEMTGNTAAIRNIKIERLKSQGMLEARLAKEEIMKAASEEAIGMLVEDTKEKIDEKAEEVREAAEERKEKEEEKEEQIEAAKENKSQSEAAVENIRENISNLTKQSVDSEDITRDMESEIQKLLEEEKLLEEDLKGLTVNTEI